jgi:hypothetical protein
MHVSSAAKKRDLKRSIAEGTYVVNPHKVAAAIIARLARGGTGPKARRRDGPTP